MAYICGMVTKEELSRLRETGHTILVCPEDLGLEKDGVVEPVMVYVDMNLPDVLEFLFPDPIGSKSINIAALRVHK